MHGLSVTCTGRRSTPESSTRYVVTQRFRNVAERIELVTDDVHAIDIELASSGHGFELREGSLQASL